MGALTGSCLCGAVRLKVSGDVNRVGACHCSQCRKQTGHYLASITVPVHTLDIEGSDGVRWYRASSVAQRGFCGTCGSVLFWHADGDDEISVAAGVFDSPTGLKLSYHIYCADKGDYYTIDDGLPQYAQNRLS